MIDNRLRGRVAAPLAIAAFLTAAPGAAAQQAREHAEHHGPETHATMRAAAAWQAGLPAGAADARSAYVEYLLARLAAAERWLPGGSP